MEHAELLVTKPSRLPGLVGILLMREGRVTVELGRDEATEELIMRHAIQHDA